VAEDAVLAIDAGTTGVTALMVDHDGMVRSQAHRELTQYYPRPGWVEQDAEEIYQVTLAVVGEALAGASEHRPVAIGVANQRETLLFWDRRSGVPLHRAVVWQCRRSESICEELRKAGLEPEIARKTGLRLDPYFSGTKALWLCREDEALRARVAAGDVRFGTVDTWLAWRLSGGQAHVTDTTNACRTLCYDIDRLAWDEELLSLFGLNPAVMPEVRPSSSVHTVTVGERALPGGVPIAALVGDQQAALFGQACFEPGMTKATYGTGCFILMSTGERRIDSKRGLLTSLAASVGEETPRYALEGSIFVAGAAVQWCRDSLGLVGDAEAAEAMASAIEDASGIVFVPAFAGLGSPHWGPNVRGAVYGLSGASEASHLVRAAVDSMAFQAQDVLDVMQEETGLTMRELRVDGGASANDRLMQLQADLAGTALSRPVSVESTGMGAAFLAGLTVGFWRDEGEIASLRQESARLEPSARAPTAKAEHARWRQAIAGLLETRLPAL
jgi:glycerol kinase